MSRRRGLLALVVISAAAVAALHAAGSGSLSAPPVTSWSALERWYDSRDPSTAIVTVLRVGGLAAALWLVGVSVLQLGAPLIAGAHGARIADSLSPRFLRSMARGAAGLSVTAGLAMPTLPTGVEGNPPGTAVMVPLDVAATTTSTVVLAPAAPAPAPPAPAAPPVAPAVDPAELDEVVVASGDSFWSIAVDEAGDRNPVRYWQALIELNRDRLVDRMNPDLLYADQVLRLPSHDLAS